MAAGRITNLDTQSSSKKSRENYGQKRGIQIKPSKQLEWLVN
jgi:hypothetical protein